MMFRCSSVSKVYATPLPAGLEASIASSLVPLISMAAGGAKRKESQQKRKRMAGTDASLSLQGPVAAKKQRAHSPDGLSGSPSDSSLSEAGSELVDCDVEFYDPKPRDTAGLKDLLQHLLDGNEFDLDQLTQAVVHQVGFLAAATQPEVWSLSRDPAESRLACQTGPGWYRGQNC